jgi:prepilin-type N-terminal cleavage/methylation domain-containing protein
MSKSSAGFTLIELLIVVSLLAIAVGVTGDVLINLTRTYNKTQVTTEIEQSANYVSQKLIKELRNSSQVTQLEEGEALALGASADEITFLDRAGNEITYLVENGIVYRDTHGGSGNEALTENDPPKGVNVTCTGGGTACFTLVETQPQVIRISLTMTQAASGGNRIFEGEVTIEDTIVIRDTY